MPENEPFLSTDDPFFSALFECFDGQSAGFRILNHNQNASDQNHGASGTSILIHGNAGTGKTTLACQMTLQSLSNINRMKLPDWPEKATAIYLTLDQRASEIANLMRRLLPEDTDEIVAESPFSIGDLIEDEDGIIGAREAANKNLVTVFPLPYDAGFSSIERYLTKLNVLTTSGTSSVRIVVIDSVNLSLQLKDLNAADVDASTQDGTRLDKTAIRTQAAEAFRKLISHPPANKIRQSERCFSTIVVYEAAASEHFPEEYFVEGIVALDCSADSHESRTIRIRKARHQPHDSGQHSFSLSDRGVEVSPSLSVWAQALRTQLLGNHQLGQQPEPPRLRMGIAPLDQILAAQSPYFTTEGSSTLLFGKPGAGKADFLARFLFQSWIEDPDSSIIFGTWKRDPLNLISDLNTLSKEHPAVIRHFKKSQGSVENAIGSRLHVLDMRDPYFSLPRVMSSIVRSVDHPSTGNPTSPYPVKRAGFFGLTNLNESPSARDEQWNFLRLLTRFLESRKVSNLLVDWPIGEQSQRNARPLAARLCANEILCEYDGTATQSKHDKTSKTAGIYQVTIMRANFHRLNADLRILPADIEIRHLAKELDM